MKIHLFILIACLAVSCQNKNAGTADSAPVLEVAGRFLYNDEIKKIIPANATLIDSADIADRYIRKWVTEVLMYENARKNIANTEEINQLVEAYRKSLIIHEYEQELVTQRVSRRITDVETRDFYETHKSHIQLEDNMIKGLLLILPREAPQLDEVHTWMRAANTKSLELIEKYSLKNAISFDYFNAWTPFAEIMRKTPFEPEDTKAFVLNTRFTSASDSTKLYLLTITDAIPMGETEPYEMAKERIANILLNKKKTDFIVDFEKSIYNDAVTQGEINFFNKK